MSERTYIHPIYGRHEARVWRIVRGRRYRLGCWLLGKTNVTEAWYAANCPPTDWRYSKRNPGVGLRDWLLWHTATWLRRCRKMRRWEDRAQRRHARRLAVAS